MIHQRVTAFNQPTCIIFRYIGNFCVRWNIYIQTSWFLIRLSFHHRISRILSNRVTRSYSTQKTNILPDHVHLETSCALFPKRLDKTAKPMRNQRRMEKKMVKFEGWRAAVRAKFRIGGGCMCVCLFDWWMSSAPGLWLGLPGEPFLPSPLSAALPLELFAAELRATVEGEKRGERESGVEV